MEKMVEIEVRNLSKTFPANEAGVAALKNLDLKIEKGSIHGIIGMSGAGKSTLVRCLNYLEKPTGGQVFIRGKELGTLTEKELRSQRSKIAMIFQHFNLLMQKNVMDNVCFPLMVRGIKRKTARNKAIELLEMVGLQEKSQAYPAQLSGGQKQRVAIARALAGDPGILLCDEATSALDPQTTASILELLQEINRKYGITIVVITHQMAVIREICSHVAIMEQGQLAEVGLVEDIFNHPRSRAARELIFREKGDVKWDDLEKQTGRKVRLVFSEQSAFEPIIANMILKFRAPVNILQADTKNVGGKAKGEMILSLPNDSGLQQQMEQYLQEKGLGIEVLADDME